MRKIVYLTYTLFLVLFIGSLLTSCNSKQQELQQAIQQAPLQATQQIGLEMQKVASNETALYQFIEQTAPNGEKIVERIVDSSKGCMDFFPGCPKFTALDMAVLVNFLTLTKFKAIKRLEICTKGLDPVSTQILASYISQLKELKFIFFEKHLLGDFGIKLLAPSLKEFTNLEFLILTNNNIGNEGLKTLALCLSEQKQLRHFYVDDNKISDDGMIYFATTCLPRLTSWSMLKFNNNEIGERGIQAIIDHLKKSELATLNLSNNPISPGKKQQLKIKIQSKLEELGMHSFSLYLD